MLILALAACEGFPISKDTDVPPAPIEGCLAGPSVDFGLVAWGEDVTMEVDVPEACGGDVAVDGVEIADPGAPFSVRMLGAPFVGAGGELALAVSLDASTGGTFASSVVIDVDGGEPIVVPVAGTVDAPALSAATDVDFGTASLGCGGSPGLDVRNLGAAPLTISGATLDDPDLGFAADVALPVVIAPGDATTLPLAWEAVRVGDVDTRLRLTTDDPARPDVVVSLHGDGVRGDQRTATFPARPTSYGTHVLLVVDDSFAMAPFADRLPSAADRVVAALDAASTDGTWVLGVTTTGLASLTTIESTDPNRAAAVEDALDVGATGAIVGPDDGGCDGTEVPTRIEGLVGDADGERWSICGDWAPAIDELALDAAGWRHRLPIGEDVVPETLDVTVGGVPVAVAWDAGARAVVLPDPVHGDVTVTYDVDACP